MPISNCESASPASASSRHFRTGGGSGQCLLQGEATGAASGPRGATVRDAERTVVNAGARDESPTEDPPRKKKAWARGPQSKSNTRLTSPSVTREAMLLLGSTVEFPESGSDVPSFFSFKIALLSCNDGQPLSGTPTAAIRPPRTTANLECVAQARLLQRQRSALQHEDTVFAWLAGYPSGRARSHPNTGPSWCLRENPG